MTITCTCGATYADTADGRRIHQMLHGHRPTPGVVRAPWREGK